jgi:hypothetical protein
MATFRSSQEINRQLPTQYAQRKKATGMQVFANWATGLDRFGRKKDTNILGDVARGVVNMATLGGLQMATRKYYRGSAGGVGAIQAANQAQAKAYVDAAITAATLGTGALAGKLGTETTKQVGTNLTASAFDKLGQSYALEGIKQTGKQGFKSAIGSAVQQGKNLATSYLSADGTKNLSKDFVQNLISKGGDTKFIEFAKQWALENKDELIKKGVDKGLEKAKEVYKEQFGNEPTMQPRGAQEVFKSSTDYDSYLNTPKINPEYIKRARNMRQGARPNYDEEGNYVDESTVRMASGEADGKYYAFPTLFQKEDGSWYEVEDPFAEAKKKGELFEFDTQDEASYFAEGGWKPKMKEGGTVPDNGKYTTKLTDKEEKEFQDWYSKVSKHKNLNPNPDAEEQKYDYRGYWKNEDREGILSEDTEAHFIDKYKQPYPHTFSTESQYSNEETLGGSWSQDESGTWFFTHSPFTAGYADKTFDYLKGSGEFSILNGDTLTYDKPPVMNREKSNFKTGGKIPNHYPSHKEGGVMAIDKKTGKPVAEVEGGEEVFSVKDTKKMESFMKKGDTKGLGKFVQGVMKKHRKNPSPTYAEEGTSNLGSEEEFDYSNPPKTFKEAVMFAKKAGAKFPEVVAAQWALESGRGKSTAGTKYNYFGIKGASEAVRKRMEEKGVNVSLGEDTLDKQTGSTDKYMDFENPLDAFKGYVAFIETNPRYKKALESGTAEEYLKEIKAAGYAEDPKYVSKISSIITDEGGNLQNEPFYTDEEIGQLEYEDEATQSKYKSYLEGEAWNSEQARELHDSINRARQEGSKYDKEVQDRERKIDLINDKIERYQKAKDEGSDLSELKGQDPSIAINKLKDERFVLKRELITFQKKRADVVHNEITPNLVNVKAEIEQKYADGIIDKEEYTRNMNALTNLDKYVVSHKNQSNEAHSKLMELNDLENRAEKYEDYQKRQMEEEARQSSFSADATKTQNFYNPATGEFEESFEFRQQSPDWGTDEIQQLADTKSYISNYDQYIEFNLDDFGFGYGRNYSEEEEEMFRTDTEGYVTGRKDYLESERKRNNSNFEKSEENNIPDGVPQELASKIMEAKYAKAEATGLTEIYNKLGGLDTLLQATGMAAAYKSATAPMPQQRKSDAWQEQMAKMKDRTQLGLDTATKTLYQRNAERTYAYDVSNIGRVATSANAALGSLGSASERKYQADMMMAAQDASLREAHQSQYMNAMEKDEAMTQEHWLRNVYNEADRKRELKAGLIGQFVNNVRDDVMYYQEYQDPNSARNQYMQTMIEGQKQAQESYLKSAITEELRGGTSASSIAERYNVDFNETEKKK